MLQEDRHFQLRLARNEADRLGAMRLRYRVFVAELGADGPGVDHDAATESDAFDAYYDQLVLVDTRRDSSRGDHVVGVYRLLRGEVALANAGFYSAGEYDLAPLLASGRRLLELGRSCVDIEYRGGTAMYHLWNGLAGYVQEHGIEVLFGVASFHGTDLLALEQPLAYLHHHHLAPEALRVRAGPESFAPMDLLPTDAVDRVAAMQAMPALIKAYLRLGGYVGEGAYVDHAFNTTDVCVLMDTSAMSARHRGFYQRPRPGRD
ncbi:MAG: GNAT family N-acetyltransferase [Rhodobacteraceae bacterium]|nr:GNAT family N-acetyltransferase [Paracoccaceae bacterium]